MDNKPRTNVINLTAHTLNCTVSGENYPPSGRVARVATGKSVAATINGSPVYATTFGEVSGLPEPENNTVYIVSALVLSIISKIRIDVMSPGNLQRDENGKPIGCAGFRYNS
jgi:hypothetical protein